MKTTSVQKIALVICALLCTPLYADLKDQLDDCVRKIAENPKDWSQRMKCSTERAQVYQVSAKLFVHVRRKRVEVEKVLTKYDLGDLEIPATATTEMTKDELEKLRIAQSEFMKSIYKRTGENWVRFATEIHEIQPFDFKPSWELRDVQLEDKSNRATAIFYLNGKANAKLRFELQEGNWLFDGEDSQYDYQLQPMGIQEPHSSQLSNGGQTKN